MPNPMRFLALSILIIFLIHRDKISCSSPPPPVKCRRNDSTDCIVTNAYGIFPDRATCRARSAVFPSSEEEAVGAVAEGSKKKQKMRVVTRWSHSIPKLVCPGGDSGLIISTRELKRIVGVDEASMTITVESGAALREVIDAAAQHNLALPQSPYWEGITVGGLLSTGAHGSSLFNKGSAVHEYVVGMKLVVPSPLGYASVVSFDESHPDLDAAKVSLGLLGVITQVTLKLQPMFKRSITNIKKDDTSVEESIVDFGRAHEFADLTWFPGQRAVIYRIDDRVSVDEAGNGINDFIGFRSTSTAGLAIARSAEELQEETKDAKGKCMTAKFQVGSILGMASGLKNDGLFFTKYPVIGYHNNLQASGSCLKSADDAPLTACPWDPRVKGEFYHQTTIAIGVSKIRDFITDIKKVRDLSPSSLCGIELYGGILMRFVKASSAHLGLDEDSVDLDITYYRSRDPMTPRLNEDVLEEIEQMGLFKYGGTPHWGKNRNIAFLGVMGKYSKAEDFLKVKEKYDGEGLMSNEWTDAMMGRGQEGLVIKKDGCALEGLCVCSEDRHCAPEKGYFCRAGRVYPGARVCRYEE